MKQTVKELEAEIRRHNQLYFEKQAPEISDPDFDRLVEELRRRAPQSPVLTEIPSDKGTERFSEVRHGVPMLSLDKCYDDETLQNWMDKFEGDLLASPKIDGCAVALRYNADGELVLAATRGNGTVGEDITANAKMIGDVPLKIPLGPPLTKGGQGGFEIRGEIYMPLSIFNKDYKNDFANPRNLAAGAIKQKDPQKTKEYRLSFFAYDLIGVRLETEWDKIGFFRKNKIPTVESERIDKEEARATFERLLKKRGSWDYETDGVVFKINRCDEQTRLGSTAHHPRFAIAYKFQGDSGVTVLRDIEWSVARTGVITPVGVVEAVTLSGASVTRVSLHNVGLMKTKGIRIGAKVLMMRRGGVIPNLESVVEAGKGPAVEVPSLCPSCGAPTELRDDFLFCSKAKECRHARIANLKHFVQVVEMDGFGEKLIERLYEAGLLQDPADFYTLKAESLLEMERMGETLAAKLIDNIQGKKELPLDLFLRALGIRELAKQTSKLLAAQFGSLEALYRVTGEDLAKIDSVGPVIAREVVEGLKKKRPLIDKLLRHVKIVGVGPRAYPHSGDHGGSPLRGKKFLFTGTLLSMPRKEAEKLVESLGGTIASGVTKDLDYLVVGGGGGAGGKVEKAKELQNKGVKIATLSEGEFNTLTKKS